MERKCVLIGSFRKNIEEIKTTAEIFKEKNIEILSPLSFDIIDPNKEFVILKSDNPNKSAIEIENEVLENMLIADFVYLVNPNGRVGLSAAYEIGYAKAKNLTVYSMTLADDLVIRGSIKSVISPQDI